MPKLEIKGLAELNAKLRTLPIELQKKLLRKSLGAAAQVIKKAAIQAAPISPRPIHRGKGRVTMPGVLKSAAIVKFLRAQSNDTQAVYIVTFRQGKKAQRIGKRGVNKDAFYASWVEFGHKVVPRAPRTWRDKRGRWRSITTLRTRRRAAVGFVEGRRFLTRAFSTQNQQALNVLVERVRSGFEAAVR